MATRIRTHGRVPEGMTEMAVKRTDAVLRRHAPEPVLGVRVTLTLSPDPAVSRPAVAQATVDLNGRVVRAQAVDETMRAAVEHMTGRLRVRLERSSRDWPARRGRMPVAEEGEWRHQNIPARRLPWFPRPQAERQVIRHRSYPPEPLTVDEALTQLELLDYDFLLFIEQSSGIPGVISRGPGDQCRLELSRPRPELGPLPAAVAVDGHGAPHMTSDHAIALLEATGQDFTFFRDAATGKAGVLYHRYDGHYGLVELA